ncbi:MAG TPA: hypothetical protein VM597_40340, partial [Gemmataceae bacterium]|nr:hypothetical protein [Gemmataceae bacterium]
MNRTAPVAVVRPSIRPRRVRRRTAPHPARAARGTWRKHFRASVVWMAVAFAGWQLALGVFVDQQPPGVRDPEYGLLEERLKARIAGHPDRPVAVFVGSSRVAIGFDAARAVADDDLTLFNFGVPGSGPFLHAAVIDRLTAAGVRPDVLFIEIVHPFYNEAGVRSLDQSLLDGARLDAAEAAGLLAYGRKSSGPLRRYAAGRALPIVRHQAELRDAAGLDVFQPGEGPRPATGAVDELGFRPRHFRPDERPVMTALAHKQYDEFFARFRLDPVPWDLLLDTIAKAKARGTRVAVVFTPEGTEFRSLYAAEVRAGVAEMMNRLRTTAGVDVIDARDWVTDDGFYDHHHLLPAGAAQFAERFRV